MTVRRLRSAWTERNGIIAVLFVLVAAAVLWRILLTPGVIGVSYDWNLPQSSVSFTQTPLSSAWTNTEMTPPGNTYYCWAFFKLLFLVGVSVGAATKAFLVLTLAMAGFSLYLLLRKLEIGAVVSLTVGLLYLASSKVLVFIHHGYFYTLMGYAFTPLMLWAYLRFRAQPRLSQALYAGLFFSLASTQIQYFAINAVLLLVVMWVTAPRWRDAIRFLVVIVITNMILSSSWMMMYLLYSNVSTYAAHISQVGNPSFQMNGIIDLLYVWFTSVTVRTFLSERGFAWFHNVWQLAQIAIIALPLLLMPIFNSRLVVRSRRIMFAMLGIFTMGLVLTKGSAYPFRWTGTLFNELPLSGIFRDLNHWYYLVTISTLISFAVALEYLWVTQFKRHSVIAVSGIVLFVGINLAPYLAGAYSAAVHQFQLSASSYESLTAQYAESTTNPTRVMWLPLGGYVLVRNDGPHFTGVNPLTRTVAAPSTEETVVEPGEASREMQLVYMESCGRIPGCAERLLGLKSVSGIVDSKDFDPATPHIASVQVSRNWRFWTPAVPSKWMDSLTLGRIVEDTDTFRLVELNNSIVSPIVSVPKQVAYVGDGSADPLVDGVVNTPEGTTAYALSSSGRELASTLVLPVDFNESSPLAIRHSNSSVSTTVDVPEDGSYKVTMYQKSGLATSPLRLFKILRVDENQRKIVLEKMDVTPASLLGKNPASVGAVDLTHGRYTVVLNNASNVTNLVLDPTFSLGPWPSRSLNCPLDGDASARQITYSGNKSAVELNNGVDGACQLTVVGNLTPHLKYIFSVDVQHVSGSLPTVCLQLDDEDYCHGAPTISQDVTGWQHIEFVYEQGSSNRAIIRLSVPGGSGTSVNRFTDVDLRRAALPETMAFVRTKTPEYPYAVQTTESRRDTATQYRVLIHGASGSVPVVLSEDFDQGWRAFVVARGDHLSGFSGGSVSSHGVFGWAINVINELKSVYGTYRKTPLADHRHVNGTENGWTLSLGNQPQDVEVVVQYVPQRAYTAGLLAGLIVIISTVTYGTIDAFRRKRKAFIHRDTV